MSIAFAVIATSILAGALGTLLLRGTVHCVLSLVVAFSGIALLYLRLDAQFLGLAQVVVYIGAIAILILFAVLLTGHEGPGTSRFSKGLLPGALAAAATLTGLIAWTLRTTLRETASEGASPSIADLGRRLMAEPVIALEIVALLLTAALIGAVLVARREPPAAP